MSETRIYVPLSREEFEALYTAAQMDYRKPRDQARHILRQALLGTQIQGKHNGAAQAVTGECGAAVTMAG